MHITARQIEDWAKGKRAQALLPRYIRQLIHTAGSITQIAVPAGDSISQPGWDGEIVSEFGTPWVPKGRSFWELSCDAQVTSKANRDYNKRTKQTPDTIRDGSTLVIVAARRWSRKVQWLKAKRDAADWAEVRVYDADDLEQWFEQSPAVALQFADELGLTGQGVESIQKHWEDWSKQTDVQILAEAFFVGRESARDRLIQCLQQRLAVKQTDPYSIRADSVEEAVAFACVALLTYPDLIASALMVTDPSGWRFVQQNPTLKIAIAASPEIAEKPVLRDGLITVIPYAAGDMVGHFRGAAGRAADAGLVLARPKISEFEKALASIGLDQGDAERLASTTGRSWSVFRRRCATNPAIRRPTWLDAPEAKALSTVCLLGAWSADKAADRDIVAQLSGRPYEEIERDLRHLARLNDAPILLIGEVWKAKSPLELLDLFGDRFTRDELDRFFHIARQVLAAPDPQLDLPDEQRYAAQIYGKVRPQSDLLIRSLCDTLVKLAVRGPQVATLAALQIESRIEAFVRELLLDADGARWLSLSSFLPKLAEAAPDVFLRSIERGLSRRDAPVTRLLTETSGSGATGRCWHAGLLWALETLAWAPERLTRVVLILARLTRVEIKGNWGNSPKATLVDIFRSWYPQTAANLEQRIAVLDTLIAKEAEVAFDLLEHLTNIGPDSASPSARPSWRDDDAGAGQGASGHEQHGMLVAAADRLIACSEDTPRRIARLVGKISIFDPPRVAATLALADRFTEASVSDDDKEMIRSALRKKISWHRNYDKVQGAALDNKLRRIEELYHRLAPRDLLVRHCWLFSESWPSLPTRVRDEDFEVRNNILEKSRIEALREIFSERRFGGIEQLATTYASLGSVGVTLARLDVPAADLVRWITGEGGDFTSREPLTMTIRGLLRALPSARCVAFLNAVLDRGKEQGWDVPKFARLLTLAREERATWDIAASCGPDVEQAYWATCDSGFWLRDDDAGSEFALQRLLRAGRPRSALHVCHFDLEKVAPKLLTEMLERMLTGEEPDGALLESYHIGQILERLEESGEIEQDRLIRLEFGLIPALGYMGEGRAKSLYSAIMSDPKLFTELLCLLYKPAHRERDEPISESMRAAAEIAWRVLHHCRRQPGTLANGTIDHAAFVQFIDDARDLCREADRLGVCDSTLGQILAHAPADANEVWPFEPARDVLDRPELEDLRHGFQIGARNKRGTTSRAYDEGGDQERTLAAMYRSHARALHNSHVNVAAALEQLARSYENDGLREDISARLRQEGH